MRKFFRITLIISIILLLIGCYDLTKNYELKNMPTEIDGNLYQKNSNDSTKSIYRIIKQINDIDIDNDGTKDEIFLYYDNYEVILMVKDTDMYLLSVDNEEQIFGDIVSDQYICDLYVNGNKVLVDFTYSYTNKYGSTSWLECYEYQNGKLNRIWDSFRLQERKIIIDMIMKRRII